MSKSTSGGTEVGRFQCKGRGRKPDLWRRELVAPRYTRWEAGKTAHREEGDGRTSGQSLLTLSFCLQNEAVASQRGFQAALIYEF
mmetsp:Transcript_33778/g.52591  ORF Transcript_33778/g.52591 Transcript_33778/m.52591 type:complete len:85 (-) Transcript_33778:768-1022(-)